MVNIITSSIIFFPSAESHFDNFLLIHKGLKDRAIPSSFLIIDEAIPNSRKFKVPNDLNTVIYNERTINDVLSSLPINSIMFVGNDSEPIICKILYKAKKNKLKIVLLQDGWLDSCNINNPIYYNNTFAYKFKKIVHKLLVSKHSPFKSYFHNFIGQNADYFFVYSEIAKNIFIEAGLDKKKIFITGSPRHTLIKNLEKKMERENVIVFFSTVSYKNKDKETIIKTFKWIINYFPNHTILIKPHPGESSLNFNEFIKDSNNKIRMFSGNIYELIESYKIDMSFCFNSTVIFDMLILGVPVIQLAPDNMLEERSNYHKNLPVATQEDEISTIIDHFDQDIILATGSLYLADINKGFDSVSTIISFINKIQKL